MNEILTPTIGDEEIPKLVEKISLLPLVDLLSLKKRIELQLTKDISYLESQGIDMNSKLVTEDGFPRQDVDDLVKVTLTRTDIIQRRNDLTAVINRSHVLLEKQLSKENNAQQEKNNANNRSTQFINHIPFAIFEEVNNNGPIGQSGIQNGDTLISFGSVNVINGGLQGLSKEVCLGKTIPINVKRDGISLTFSVTPNNQWGGRGLLGCKLTKL
ncbi:similar to Saccharomyces cerevisiae YIL007C NAS2 Proteasome-interacting protein involved in the assembly of the base subcomplex of the 19S proteasomal regulatory particle (RP) [Maudiozyma barnettii]|uniref:Probable 26S proteasome regulatory subunit p27 n=1 Tax=Maudiozyma barnettii TaxID=61262 RepID=A0A8H2ZJC3_9SACH|nr:Nas2p [Kazachstania barnettii]CAB4256382.1 similar to Saccharomyces cerevisiae YIL007C NAS2 Proteasome-interacting protein involved in the assembly of the base subcomplex of the 19S proteasomal regulatory particle (RP) [Kazachstania barnettii]CAD1784991.1 similar to Saccharomyces cerevisiae YIL007C NAS2 Proteasome-interacting protein involved in the assembly of the base subcomplex of the 19S proteasomal regulatory particle (RP) [Kazachstania barnettii]